MEGNNKRVWGGVCLRGGRLWAGEREEMKMKTNINIIDIEGCMILSVWQESEDISLTKRELFCFMSTLQLMFCQ